MKDLRTLLLEYARTDNAFMHSVNKFFDDAAGDIYDAVWMALYPKALDLIDAVDDSRRRAIKMEDLISELSEYIVDGEMVPNESICPQCRERRIDKLIWVTDDAVECAVCKKRYEPVN